MANTLTPEQFEQACKNAIVSVEKNISKILINATNIGSAEMQFRIFNKGQTVAGNTMRYRSAPYKKLRTDAGLQTNWKDLIFTGDLFYSMSILGTANKEVVYGFNNMRTAEIAGYQEESKQVGEPIFELNLKEYNQMERQFSLDVAKVFKGALESFPNMPGVSNIGKSATEKSIARNKAKKKKAKSKTSTNAKLTKQIESKEKTKEAVKKQKDLVSKREASLRKSQERLADLKNKKTFQESQFDKRRAIADKKQASLIKSQNALTKKKKAEAKAKERARIARAKQLRMGTYKPKKRKP
jgi:hypothetical protein